MLAIRFNLNFPPKKKRKFFFSPLNLWLRVEVPCIEREVCTGRGELDPLGRLYAVHHPVAKIAVLTILKEEVAIKFGSVSVVYKVSAELGVAHWHTFVVRKYLNFLGAQVGALFSNFGCESS